MTAPGPNESPRDQALVRAHLRFGWWCSLAFLALGIALELLHAFKIQWLLGVENTARREMWTLAHAHGTLLGLFNIAFAVTIDRAPAFAPTPRLLAARCLQAASLLMPLGFFLGGLWIHGGDPGIGVLLVPPGGLLLLAAAFLTARGV